MLENASFEREKCMLGNVVVPFHSGFFFPTVEFWLWSKKKGEDIFSFFVSARFGGMPGKEREREGHKFSFSLFLSISLSVSFFLSPLPTQSVKKCPHAPVACQAREIQGSIHMGRGCLLGDTCWLWKTLFFSLPLHFSVACIDWILSEASEQVFQGELKGFNSCSLTQRGAKTQNFNQRNKVV